MFPWLTGRWWETPPSNTPPDEFRRIGRNTALVGVAVTALGYWLDSPIAFIGILAVAIGVLVYITGRSREKGGGAEGPKVFLQHGKVDYIRGAPAWPVRVVHPSRFRGVDYDLQFEVFKLPKGALLACLLRLYDIPDTPFFIHRIFDLTQHDVGEYLDHLGDSGSWTLVLESKGTELGITRHLKVDALKLRRLVHEALRYNRTLSLVSGAAAMDQFLRVFEPEAEKSGCEAGWRAVEAWCRSRGIE